MFLYINCIRVIDLIIVLSVAFEGKEVTAISEAEEKETNRTSADSQ